MNDASLIKEAPSRTVLHYLVSPVPVAADWETAGHARARLVGQHHADASHVFLLAPDGRLVGIAAIRDLLAASEETPVRAIVRDAAPYLCRTRDGPGGGRQPGDHAGLSTPSAMRMTVCLASFPPGP